MKKKQPDMKQTLFILAFMLPLLLTGQKSALEDYFKGYLAALNNLGDVRNSMDDRSLFRTDILEEFFMSGQESMVYNHLRSTGTRVISAKEYLDIIITDFPEGVRFRFDSLELIDFQMGEKYSEATVHITFGVAPKGKEMVPVPLSFIFHISGMSPDRVSGRIKSINHIPESITSAFDLEAITNASMPNEPEQEATTASEERPDNANHPIEVDPTLPKEIQELEKSMVFVEGGRFRMGCTGEQGSRCKSSEKPVHMAEVSSFYIGKFEVTQAQWKAITGNNPSRNEDCENCPVENVSWDDANGYIKKLNQLTGKKYRLPTEAEWEYAARGGKQSQNYIYAGGNDPKQLAWYYKNSDRSTSSVGLQLPNELGLYDMSGNVWEWCINWFEQYSPSPKRERSGSNSKKVVRGGYWYSQPDDLRCAKRESESPKNRNSHTGFRLCLSVD